MNSRKRPVSVRLRAIADSTNNPKTGGGDMNWIWSAVAGTTSAVVAQTLKAHGFDFPQSIAIATLAGVGLAYILRNLWRIFLG